MPGSTVFFLLDYNEWPHDACTCVRYQRTFSHYIGTSGYSLAYAERNRPDLSLISHFKKTFSRPRPIGVARILSGVYFFSQKIDDLFLVVALKIAS